MENIKVFVMANIIITDADEYKNYEKAEAIIKIMAEEFKILGTYKNARK